MKVLDIVHNHHAELWDMFHIKYELDDKVNTTPIYVIRDNQLVKVVDLPEYKKYI